MWPSNNKRLAHVPVATQLLFFCLLCFCSLLSIADENLTALTANKEPEKSSSPSKLENDAQDSTKVVDKTAAKHTEENPLNNVFTAADSPEKKALQAIIKRWQSYLYQLEQFNGNEETKYQTAAGLQSQIFKDIQQIQHQLRTENLNDNNWQTIELHRLTIHYLIGVRTQLWRLAKHHNQGELGGYSAVGIKSAKQEIHFLITSLDVHIYWLKLWLSKNIHDIATSPVPQLILLFKLFFFTLLLTFAFKFTRTYTHLSTQSASILSKFKISERWIKALRKPLILWIYSYYCFEAIFTVTKLPEVELLLLVLNTAFSAWLIYAVLIAWLAVRPSLIELDTAVRIRLLCVPKYLFIIILLLLVKGEVSQYLLGLGTLGSWLGQAVLWVLFIYCIIELHRWNALLLSSVKRYARTYRKWDAVLHQRRLFKVVGSCAAITILLLQGVQSRLAFFIKRNENARKLMAYWSRQEISKLSEEDKRLDEQLISETDAGVFLPEFTPDNFIDYADKELEELMQLVDKEERCFVAITAPRGMGKTSLLQRIMKNDNLSVKYLECPFVNIDIYKNLAELLGITDYESEEQLLSVLKKYPKTTICLDDCQRLIVPSIGGLELFEKLITLISKASGNISWVMAFESPAWQFFTRVRGERIIFDKVIGLPKWNEAQMLRLINARCKQADIKPDFTDLFLPSPQAQEWLADEETHDEDREKVEEDLPDEEISTRERRLALVEEANKTRSQMKAYIRILWDFSGGNPTVCLWAWRRSLFRKLDSGELIVGLFKPVDSQELDRLPNLMLFVLKTILQMEKASETSIAIATNLPEKEVSDAVRYLLGRNYIDRHDGQFSISSDWLRPISVLLVRQHLLQEV